MIYQFEPLLRQTLWGGDKIIAFKHLDSHLDHVGESWELSGVEGSETVVKGGPDAGKTLNQLVAEQQAALVGHDNYSRFGNEFPLLVKFIDASQDLSIQVHPSDEVARRQGRHRGKTEMWYALDCEPGAQLYNGLSHRLTPDDYKRMVGDNTIIQALARYEVSHGDVFFIPAGRIHAIGAGCFVAEIQQTSDVTYRIYDFNRRDKDGNLRELHTHEAAEAIDYTVLSDYRTTYPRLRDEGVQVVSCPYFTTAVYDLTEAMTLDYSELDSFVVLIAVAGSATLSCQGQTIDFQAGDTVLLPATTDEVVVGGGVQFLETYV